MKAVIADSTKTIGLTVRRLTLQKVLFICGILYFPLYFTGHILAGMQLEGYSHLDQMVSELSAIGVPTRPLLDVFGIAGNVLLIAFGMGVWDASGDKRPLRATGIMIAVLGVLAFSWWFAPMSSRASEKGANDIAHVAIAYTEVLLLMLIIGFGSAADGRWFRVYSILTILASLAAGIWVGTQVPLIAQGLPTPWAGAIERMSVYGPLVWMMVLAIILLHEQMGQVVRAKR
ncbi:MAG TPA: DUF998 domain-containing protein [Anaerolineales bacterium]|nr:DUF998 domain-containing protein [Anaerolineales bacterium]HLO32247.1 DUF998 domain-containing protein [Anaerolineales bacterium]